MIKAIAKNGQIPAPANIPLKPIPLNNDVIPSKIKPKTAAINASIPIKIHHPIGLTKQANNKIPITIKKFFILSVCLILHFKYIYFFYIRKMNLKNFNLFLFQINKLSNKLIILKMYKPLQKSPWYNAHHTQDNRKNLGYDYHGHVLENTMSKPIFSNKKNKAMLQKVECMLNYLIDTVKQIKLQYLISMDKNDINLN